MTEHNTPDAFETFKQAAEQFAQQVPLEYRQCGNERDYPVPSGHAPRCETHDSDGYYGIMVAERGGLDTGAWIHCEKPWSVDE